MEFVLASINDCMELSYLKKHIWETTYRGIYSDSKIDNYNYEERKQKFVNLINSDNQEVYVCKDDDKIIGYMVLGEPLHGTVKGYDLCINDLGIEENNRGKGIGKKFMEIVKSKNRKFFNCCNTYNEKAKKFYEKMGGRIIKEEKDENKEYCQVYFIY